MGVFPRMLGLAAVFTGRLIMLEEGTRGRKTGFLGATSLLAVLHRNFLADKSVFFIVFVFLSSHS